MALIIEDGSVITDANSYVTVSYAATYMLNRTDAAWSAATEQQQMKALFQAGQYLNTLNWKGSKTGDSDQSMELPRVNFTDGDEYAIATNKIPTKVKQAQIEAAVSYLNGETLFATISSSDRLKRKKIDVIEKEWFSGGNSIHRTTFDYVMNLLEGYLTAKGTIRRA